jgi:apolipoprotein N-acyltransferase
MAFLLNKKSHVVTAFFILGIIFSLGFDPYNLPFISILSIGIFFLLNDYIYSHFKKNFIFFFLTGLAFGFSFFLFSMYWVSNSILVYPDLNYLIPIPLIGLPLILGTFYGLMQVSNFLFWNNNATRIFYFSIFWTLFEIIRGTFFTGLPWNLVAYSWTWSLSIMQSLSIFGVYGLCFISCIISSSLFFSRFKKNTLLYPLISIFILSLIFIYGYIRIDNYHDSYESTQEVRLISSNFEQNIKWSQESINKVMQLGSKDKLSIFPETSIGFTKNIPNNWITGSVRKENEKYYNSMQYDGDFYNKQKLVPFTEFLPFESFLRLIDFNKLIPKNFFSEGKDGQDFNRKLLPSICYEGIFPMQILSKITDDTLVIINISNDAWFGKNAGPKQHLTHVRYRTIESGLPMIRSTNKGYSVLVNPIGRVIESIPINELNFIEFKIPNRLNKTIYAKYRDWPIIILIALLFILLYILEVTIFRKRSL